MAFNQVTWPYRFLFLLVFSVALMIVDHRSALLAPLRTMASVVNLPFQLLLHAPTATVNRLSAYYPDDSLQQKYDGLLAQQTLLNARLQRYESLRADNRRLTELLAISERSEQQATLAEIVEIGLGPFAHQLALNRGTEAGVYLGQPVITSDGVLGQISGLGVYRSVVTLITDPSHALPVQVQRNGLRTIVRGVGGGNRLEVPFLASQADLRDGDVLVTSGLGGGFPAGYKVAEVREIMIDEGAEFMRVVAEPYADVAYTREALLLRVGEGDGDADGVSGGAVTDGDAGDTVTGDGTGDTATVTGTGDTVTADTDTSDTASTSVTGTDSTGTSDTGTGTGDGDDAVTGDTVTGGTTETAQ